MIFKTLYDTIYDSIGNYVILKTVVLPNLAVYLFDKVITVDDVFKYSMYVISLTTSILGLLVQIRKFKKK